MNVNSVSDKCFDLSGMGMSMIDLLQIVDDFPSGGGVTETRECRLMGGGPVPTALCTAAKLGASTAVIDRIGDDWRGKLVADEYRGYGVNCDNLILEHGKTTSFGSVLVRKRDGERHVIFSPGDFSPLETSELPMSLLRHGSRLLHLNGRHWPACVEAAKMVRAGGGLVSFDGGANRFDKKFIELLELTDILIVARDFAERLSGSNDIADQLASLVRYGAKIVAVTDGAKGSWFATDEGDVFFQPAFAVQPVVDTTGCGDAFHGGFLYAHSQGWNLREAAVFASAVAGCNAMALGGRGHLPSLQEARTIIETVAFR